MKKQNIWRRIPKISRNTKHCLILLLDQFAEEKYIKKYDYRLFNGLMEQFSLVSQSKIDSIYEKIARLEMNSEAVDKYTWDIKREISKNKDAVILLSQYILFDWQMSRKPFVNYDDKDRDVLKMIFSLMIRGYALGS